MSVRAALNDTITPASTLSLFALAGVLAFASWGCGAALPPDGASALGEAPAGSAGSDGSATATDSHLGDDGVPLDEDTAGEASAPAQDSTADALAWRALPPALAQRIRSHAAPLVGPLGARGKSLGLAVAVLTPRFRGVVGLGAARVGGAAPGGRTLFEIGSVTKVFTGFLLARSAERGTHPLHERIDAYFPRGAPSFGGRSITLLDLATHTSGLPPMPDNLHAPPPNPAAGYSAADLADFLARFRLQSAPGTRYVYSNAGAGTLGYVLGAPAPGLPSRYDVTLRREVTVPLALPDTVLALSPAQRWRAAQGYAGGSPAAENDIGPALVGGGSIRSTPEDLLRFLEPAIGLAPASRAAATWRAVMQPRATIPSGFIGLGLVINTEASPVVYEKAGGTAGFTSHVAFTTTPPAAVVILANTHGTAGLDGVAKAILAELRAP